MQAGSGKWAGAELGLWALSLIVFPFYIFARGGVQPSNMIMGVMFLVIAVHAFKLSGFPLPAAGRSLLAPLAAFVMYAFVVNYTWYLVLSWTKTFITPFFYVFDFLVVASGLFLYAQYGLRFIAVTRVALLFSITLQFALSFLITHKTEYRQGLFFGGYSQLGYFALVSASIFTVPVRGANWKLPPALFSVGVVMCLWLAMLSLSKAAILSIIFFALVSAMSSVRQTFFMGLLIALALVFDTGGLSTRLGMVSSRLSELGSGQRGGDDTAAGRGYDRIWDNPEMLILGAGEAANYRWDSFSKTGELHSTIGTIVFSYGIPGTLFAAAFFVAMIRPAWRVLIIFAIPELLYSLTHMSLRFVMTWVYFVTLFCVGLEIHKQRTRQRNRRSDQPGPVSPNVHRVPLTTHRSWTNE